ncbi:hypothetical protein RB614_36515 [Phytohabitans sp. ZYX-F-186]|uniref:Uncharacterized protein n=1 Tax=Phytohabitans maris TaxID=3071409 RepID=A0ABU0ZSK5_9ACTN|nr:hypothetical protein [Phytohabitans sp. ZYX-F-186]MDQ7910016.1 hypothetical protein [Phytohabitans sp. ZYX-F-186]
MGALVTLELPEDSPALELPWIVTFGPLGDAEEWEPVVCGPYERPHALALAESVVADEDLMAVVEPLLPHVTVEEIQGEIAAARMAAEDERATADDAADFEDYDELTLNGADAVDEDQMVEASPPPPPEEVRAGMTRIAARLAG